jgi:hypothetical protein
MKTPGQRFYEAAYPNGIAWDNLTITERDGYERGAKAIAPEDGRPWWAAVLTSGLTTLFGIALVLIAVIVVRPSVGPDYSEVWIGILIGGMSAAGIGGSLLGRSPPPRGFSRVGLLIGILIAGLLAALLPGCSLIERREVHTETAPEVQLEDAPDGRCYARGFADGHELLTIIGPVGERCPEVEVITRPAPVTP